MKNIIKISGQWKRNGAITFEVAKGTQEEGKPASFTERTPKETTDIVSDEYDELTAREYFESKFKGENAELWINID